MSDSKERIAELERQIRELTDRFERLEKLLNKPKVSHSKGQPTFSVINVERINVVDADGVTRLVIHNQDRRPGRETRKGDSLAGIVFYSETGEEAGAIGVSNTVSLLFDQYRSDQVLGVVNWETGEGEILRRGLMLWDRPYGPIEGYVQKFREEHGRWPTATEIETPRIFVGRRFDETRVVLSDSKGRDRLRLVIDSKDNARIEFLKENGEVYFRLPDDALTLRIPTLDAVPQDPDGQTVAHLLGDMGNNIDRTLEMLDEIRDYLGDEVYYEWKQWLNEAKKLNTGA